MKNKKHTEDNQEVKDGCETQETQTSEATKTPETTEEAADQIVDEMELMAQKCVELNDKNLTLDG
jgi:hypothetical protein